MLKAVPSIVVVMLLFAAAGCKKKKEEAKVDLGPTYKDVIESLDATKKTEVAIKQYWENNKDKSVTWTAKVHDVQSVRGGAQLKLAFPGFPLYDGYNIEALTGDVDNAGKLEKGQMVKIRGRLARYTKPRNGPMIINLNNVEILVQKAK